MGTFERQLQTVERNRLRDFLLHTIQLYREFMDRHGYEDQAARYTAVGDMVDGVDAIVELEEEQNPTPAGGIRLDPLWDEDRIRRFVARTVGMENLPTSREEMVKYASAAVETVASHYERDRNENNARIEYLETEMIKLKEEYQRESRRVVELEEELTRSGRVVEAFERVTNIVSGIVVRGEFND